MRIPAVEVDYKAVIERARAMAVRSRTGLAANLGSTDNLSLIPAHARFEGREAAGFRVRVGDQAVLAKNVVLDSGTRSVIPPIEGLQDAGCIHAGNWLDVAELPGKLAIIGGGYIGVEMAQLYRRLGSEVTIIESGGQIAGQEDADVASRLQELLEAEGIAFRLNARVEKVEGKSAMLKLHVAGATLDATHIFSATGRRPNTDDLGLESVGVRTDEHGFVQVDKRLATSVNGVWAAGDVRGGPMFTHTAWDDYRVIESQLAGDGSRTTERVVPAMR